MTTSTPTSFGRYEVMRLLQSGGMADVYLGKDPLQHGREVAIKAPRLEALTPETMRRFRDEAQTAALLEHPAIVSLLDFGEQDGRPFLILDYIAGGSLADGLSREAYTPLEAVSILERIASALDYAHRMGVLHRDVKPGNILVDAQGMAYLTDFGIALLRQSNERDKTQLRITGTGETVGTAAYMSPEQASGDRQLGPQADIYSLGVVLFEMLCGSLPFEGENSLQTALMHRVAPVPQIRQRRSDLPSDIQIVVDKALAKEPSRRYQTAGEMIDDLRRLAIGQRLADRPRWLTRELLHADLRRYIAVEWARFRSRGSVAYAAYSTRVRQRVAGDCERIVFIELLPLFPSSTATRSGPSEKAYSRLRARGRFALIVLLTAVFTTRLLWERGGGGNVPPVFDAGSLLSLLNGPGLTTNFLRLASIRLLANAFVPIIALLLLGLFTLCQLYAEVARYVGTQCYWRDRREPLRTYLLNHRADENLVELLREVKLKKVDKKKIARDWERACKDREHSESSQQTIDPRERVVDGLIARCEEQGQLWQLALSVGMITEYPEADEEPVAPWARRLRSSATLAFAAIIVLILLVAPAVYYWLTTSDIALGPDPISALSLVILWPVTGLVLLIVLPR